MKGHRLIGRVCYQLLIIIIGLILFISIYMNQNISYEQLDINPEIKNLEYSNGTLYYTYESPQIEIIFKYPFNWKLLEFIDQFPSHDKVILSHDKVISFELKDSEPYNQPKNKQIKNYFNDFYPYFPPLLSISSYDLKFKNVSIKEFAKIKNEDLRNLFTDFKITLITNNIKYIGRENIPAWMFEYSIEDAYTSNESPKDKRNGLNIWILRGDKVYEIEYIANSEGYFKNLREVTKLIDSIRFR
jgi:hypothetical protein